MQTTAGPPHAPSADATPFARLSLAVAATGWGLVAAAVAAAVLAPDAAAAAMFAPLLIGIVAFGLPHGALDHVVPARVGFAWGRTPAGVTAFLGAYLALAVATLAAWTVAPAAAFAAFLVATVAHWGQGDLRFLQLHLGRRALGWGDALATGALRGALPVAIPVLAYPDVVAGLLEHAATAVGAGGALPDPGAAPVRLVTAALLVGSGLGWLATLRRAWRTRVGVTLDVAEVALLAATFLLVPPYLAIGVYFLFWHALRHLVRLLVLRPRERRDVAEGRTARGWARLARDLTPMTVLAIGVLVGLWAWAAPRIDGAEGYVATYLVWISALTMPHMAVVAAMDVAPDAARPARG
jgi:Brp/Blh family beta-carotene 15,15'-monooxygenase